MYHALMLHLMCNPHLHVERDIKVNLKHHGAREGKIMLRFIIEDFVSSRETKGKPQKGFVEAKP